MQSALLFVVVLLSEAPVAVGSRLRTAFNSCAPVCASKQGLARGMQSALLRARAQACNLMVPSILREKIDHSSEMCDLAAQGVNFFERLLHACCRYRSLARRGGGLGSSSFGFCETVHNWHRLANFSGAS